MSLQVHGLLDLAEMRDIDERGTLRQAKQIRDSRLLQRLNEIIPFEELASATQGDGINLDELRIRFPFVYMMWVMDTATEMSELSEIITRSVTERGASASQDSRESD
jgi:hypothetical protein